jgi:hypothetical protein
MASLHRVWSDSFQKGADGAIYCSDPVSSTRPQSPGDGRNPCRKLRETRRRGPGLTPSRAAGWASGNLQSRPQALVELD